MFPEGHFGGTVVVAHTWLQANMQVELVLGVVLRPGHLFEAVGLSVDELGVLGNWFVRIPAAREKTDVLMLSDSVFNISLSQQKNLKRKHSSFIIKDMIFE